MAVSDTYVRARIDNATKERATAALGAMGLSISDAIHAYVLRGILRIGAGAAANIPPCAK